MGDGLPSNREYTVYAHLRQFATHPDFTRQGIAKALWNRSWQDICISLTEGSENGKRTEAAATVETLATLTAVPFYTSLGFKQIRPVELSLGVDCKFPCVLMRRIPNESDGL